MGVVVRVTLTCCVRVRVVLTVAVMVGDAVGSTVMVAVVVAVTVVVGTHGSTRSAVVSVIPGVVFASRIGVAVGGHATTVVVDARVTVA